MNSETAKPEAATQPAIKSGIREIDGRKYMTDAKGALVPLSLVKPMDQLIDQAVRKMIQYSSELSDQIGRFKGYTFEDIGALQALLEQEYGVKRGGTKGNVTLTSFDGCLKVQLQKADLIEFGPELQAAKSLVDECLVDWTSESRDELRDLVMRAFQVDQDGRINRSELFSILRKEISDPRWQRAMEAIKDSIRVIGSKAYLRFYTRPAPDAAWQAVSIDLAQA